MNVVFNDLYFTHISSTISRFLVEDREAHKVIVVVLGDLFSYQYTGDAEFRDRVRRYNQIFEPFTSRVRDPCDDVTRES